MRRNPIRRVESPHFISASVAGLFALLACSVSAQSPSPTPATAASPSEAEPVIVTGSQIPTQTAAEVGANPVQVIDRYTIERSGERNTEELLRNQPVANANGVPTSGNAGAIYGQGASSVSLRGFDPGATLVLIDGHRMVSHPSGTNGGFDFFVDLNTIPLAAIESVEILKDGASTTYGADAVAGVVNIKLRHNYQGAEAYAEYGNSTDTDSGETAASILFGVGDNNTHLTGVANYYSRNSIFSRDRDYDRRTSLPSSIKTTFSEPYNLELSRSAVVAAGGNPPPELGDTFFGHAPFFSNGTAPASDYVYFPDPSDKAAAHFPVNHFAGELPDTERYGAFIMADHKIFGDQMVAYGDVFFERDDVRNELAPAPTVSGQRVAIAIPPHVPGPILGGPSYADTGVPPGAYNPFNPFQQIISGGTRARLFEFGNQKFDDLTDAFFTTVGLRGDKLLDGNWGYDAAFRYSHIDATTDFTVPSITRFNRVLNAADPIFDPASRQFIGTTIPFNPFGDFRRIIPNNYRLADFVIVHPREEDISRLAVFDLNIYNTKLLDLPAGGVGLAFGAQFQDETLSQDIDKRLETGDINLFQLIPFSANRNSYAGYVEMSIPVFGDNFSMPGFHALEFTGAARYESFSNGSNVMVPKLGLRWQPFDDSLTVRATWGEGYRLPSLPQLYTPVFSEAQTFIDPVKKMPVDVPTVFLPNADLQPEDSRNFSAGVVYTPKFAPGLTVSIDLFDIETTGRVLDASSDPARTVSRIESGNAFPGESVVRDANGNLVSITQVSFENSGTQKARGADFSIAYELQTVVGTFRSTILATYLDSFQVSFFPGQAAQELRSSPTDLSFSDDAYLKWKGLSQLGWHWNGFDTVFTTHYRDGFHEIQPGPNGVREHWVKQTWFFDVQASYEFGTISPSNYAERFHNGWPTWRYLFDQTTITLGVNNIFDHDPPRSNDNFPRFIYDPTGRFIYASVTKRFW
jgi:iron complex outermembrane receptor protein